MTIVKNVFDFFRFPLILLGVLITAGLSSCDDDADDNSMAASTIAATAQSNSNLTSLTAALTMFPDLVSTLDGTGQYTVFAPTNEAFDAFLTAIGQESIDDIPAEVLRSVLEYHVVAGAEVKSTDLSNGPVETVLGEDISVNVTGGVTLNGSAGVLTADLDASNGVVHVIDEVLVPPSMQAIVGTIVAPAYFNKDFTTLVAAVVQAGLLETLIDPAANLTLFAPTNAAFETAGITVLPADNDEGNALLTSILTYHVVGSAVSSSELPLTTVTPAEVETLGGVVYLTNKGEGVFLNGSSEVIMPDISASNGIVHVIDRTLLPPDKTIAGIALEYNGASTPEFTQLVAALSKIPALLDAADDETATLTVFAPTDAAFQNLYTALGVADLNELVAEIGLDGLTKVLQHHILGQVAFSSDLESGDVPTLSGESLALDLSALTLTDGSNSTPPSALVPSLLNVHATNGVIHVIDKVLIPTL